VFLSTRGERNGGERQDHAAVVAVVSAFVRFVVAAHARDIERSIRFPRAKLARVARQSRQSRRDVKRD